MADLLAVAPHPDDIELFAGGTVAAWVNEGREAVLLDLTAGELATRGTPERRAREATEAARALGVSVRVGLGLPDGGLDGSDPGQLLPLVEAIREHRPRVVITTHENDDHPDHVEGARLVKRAVYLAGLRNFAPGGRDPHRPRRLLFAMGRRPIPVSLIVDVTAVYDHKRRALAAFESQFTRQPGDPRTTPISDPGFLAGIEARDRTYGGQIGVEFGEPFHQEGPVAVHRAADLAEEQS